MPPTLADGLWRGQRCFVLGGGPSLADFDLSKLRDELTVGVNMAFLLNPTVNLVTDLRFMQQLSEDPRWKEYKGLKLWLYSGQRAWKNAFPDVTRVNECVRERKPAWSRTFGEGIYRGTNAGIAALNLATVLGADPVYLLGYDLAASNGKTANWHSEYKEKWTQQDSVYLRYIQDFKARKDSGAIKARVVNVNMDSGLKCFEFPSRSDGAMLTEMGWKPRDPRPDRAHLPPCAVDGFRGFGDTIYMRPALLKLLERHSTVYLTTAWPQLFWDIPDIACVRPASMNLRTQAQNMNRMGPGVYHPLPPGLKRYVYRYYMREMMKGHSPIVTFMGQFRVEDPVEFRIPVNPEWRRPWMEDLPRPLGIVRAPSVRREWPNSSRNPHPEYMQRLVDAAPEIKWVSVGHLSEGAEWTAGPPLKGLVKSFDHGELSTEELAALVGRADIVLTPPCFLLPLGAAMGAPTFCVFGGSVPPPILIDRRMGPKVGHVAPQPFCSCFQMSHRCNLTISSEQLRDTFRAFLETHLAGRLG